MKSDSQTRNLILVTPSKKFKTINEFLENDFINENANDFVINPEDQSEYSHVLEGPIVDKVSIPSTTTFKIYNYPKVLIFGVERFAWKVRNQELEFLNTPLRFPDTLMIENEEYSLLSNIEFDPSRFHYIARNFDFFNNRCYVHDDRKVEQVPTSVLPISVSQLSSMVFYVKKRLLREFLADPSKLDISEELACKLKPRSNKRLKRTYTDENADVIESESKKQRTNSFKESENIIE